MNSTDDPRDEIVLWNQDKVWIDTQDQPFAGENISAPEHNPRYNDSNYRINVSWPGWHSATP